MRNNIITMKVVTQGEVRKVGWVNLFFLSLSPLIAFIGLWYWLKGGHFNWNTVILGLVFTSIIQVSITAGYHRLFSHRCFKAAWPVKLFFLIFGAAAFEGSALTWSLDHRDHHNYVDDKEKDPYAITRGFLWAHIGWLLFKPLEARRNPVKAGDLLKDPMIIWQDKWWMLMGILAGYVLPAVIALAWHDLWGGLLIAGFLRAVINHHSTFLINSLSHCFGKQTYSDKHSARDNLFTAILTFGEGYHNYHHEFSSDYRNGPRFYDWDPTKWVIKGLSYVGLTSNLKTIREEIIIRKRWQMTEKRLLQKIARHDAKLAEGHGQILSQLKDKIETAFKELTKLRDEHQIVQRRGRKLVILELQILKRKIANAREEFLRYIQEWNYNHNLVLARVKV